MADTYRGILHGIYKSAVGPWQEIGPTALTVQNVLFLFEVLPKSVRDSARIYVTIEVFRFLPFDTHMV